MVIYYTFFQLANVLTISPHVSAFYPTPAASVSFLAIFGIRYLPVFILAALVTNTPEHPFWTLGPLEHWMQLRQILVYGTTGLMLNFVFSNRVPIKTTQDTLIFVFVAAIAALISAILARWIFVHFDTFPPEILNDVFLSFWVGDLAGLVIVGPLMFIFVDALKNGALIDGARKYLESSILTRETGILLLGIGLPFAYMYVTEAPLGLRLGVLCFVPIILGATRLGFVKGYLAAFISCVLLVIAIQHSGGVSDSSLDTQLFFIVLTVVGMIVGAEKDGRFAAEQETLEKQERLNHLSRVSAIGEVGVKIAHEINQPLAAISIHSQLSLDQIDNPKLDRKKLKSSLEQINEASQFAGTIHKKITGLAKSPDETENTTQLAECIAKAKAMLMDEPSASEIWLESNTPENIPPVFSNPVELQQVFINLIRNSIDAINEHNAGGGKIKISSSLNEKNLVEVLFEDTGPGVAKEIIPSLFNTYTSTKDDGVGIGLAVASSILEKFGGRIWYDETLPNGGAFKMTLSVAT